MAIGRWPCGAVRYRVRGPLAGVPALPLRGLPALARPRVGELCGGEGDLELVESGGLRWFATTTGDARARRGFGAECGSSLFWEAPGHETISIAAGTLDAPTGSRVVSHWFVSRAGDYYELPDDRLPHHARSGEGELA